jgi:hypothetical protein
VTEERAVKEEILSVHDSQSKKSPVNAWRRLKERWPLARVERKERRSIDIKDTVCLLLPQEWTVILRGSSSQDNSETGKEADNNHSQTVDLANVK